MPRSVTPEEFMDTSEPHNFSLGVCRLTMTMEFGSKNALDSLRFAESFRPEFFSASRLAVCNTLRKNSQLSFRGPVLPEESAFSSCCGKADPSLCSG